MKIQTIAFFSWVFQSGVHVDAAGCPFTSQGFKDDSAASAKHKRELRLLSNRRGDGGVPAGGFSVVKEDIKSLLTDSQDFFPADFESPIGPNYGGLMIRLAWHCAGSYRDSDGRGGCDGGRIRFDPELNWPDNANLNQALQLLQPIKEKYGSNLSWGDLIILAGNTAIESMGGPILGFCGGRVDDQNGADSLVLGPSDEQEAIAPCQTLNPSQQGLCNLVEESPIGPTTVGLIYVNPEGPKGQEGDPLASANDIRYTFARMGFNDTETTALVGGGHAFGKCHGACPNPPCGIGTSMEGKGINTFTSGFEGQWTTIPTTWSNLYFQNLFDLEWEIGTGPGGKIQFFPKTTDGADAPFIMMLTSDIAFSADPMYKAISQEYASNIESLERDFMHAWYKLTSSDMGPATRCIGEDIPAPQFFQNPLPADSASQPDFVLVRNHIQELLDSDGTNGPAFINLAYRCASTFRATDFKGGCNGARIRFSPEADWGSNQGTAEAIITLTTVKDKFPDASMADIIVLAGQAALEDAGGNAISFCAGRVDAMDGSGSEILAPRTYSPAVVSIRDDFQVKGLSTREGVALAGRPTTPGNFTNQFFNDLINGVGEFSKEELALLEEEFLEHVERFADKDEVFQEVFSATWKKIMDADRFDGPFESACVRVNTPTLEHTPTLAPQSSGKKGCEWQDVLYGLAFIYTLLAFL